MSISETLFFSLKKGCSVKTEKFFGGIAEKYYKNGQYVLLRIRGIDRDIFFKIGATNDFGR